MRRKSENPSRTSALAATLVGLLFLSCSPSSPTDPGQTQGQIQVNVSTSGTGVPSNFAVTLDGGSSRSVSPNGSVTYGSLNPGNYTVELSVPGNCTISGLAERPVGVQEGSTSTVAYSVTCSAVPTGAIGVTTSTTGSPADPDGYTVSVDGGAARAIGVDDNLLIPDLGLGDHEVELSGVADNCLVQGANPRTVSVSENQTTPTEFEVTCSATTGRIDVTVATTGQALDADGYDVELDGGTVTREVDTNGSVDFTGVEQGEHTLTLDDVASNCTVAGDNPVSVEVVAGETVNASFTVECEATTGGLAVTATTTGDELDPNGYAVSVDGSLEQTIGVNGSTTFPDLPPGDHEVELAGVAANCAVGGENPRTVEVLAGETASTNFDVTCSSTVGSIEVAVTTTGEAIDADGYSVVLDGGVSTQLVDANDTVVFGGLVPDEYTLDLGNVAGNCTVTSDNPATAEVTAGAQTDVAFTVECEELTGDIQVDMSTTGSSPDPDGYTVSLDGGSGLSVSNNGSRTFSDVVIGEYEIEIGDVASNCAVQGGNSRDVTVNENQTTQVDFDVECSATAGAIEVTVTTTGEDQDDSYFVVLLESGDSQLIDANDTATFGGLTPDEYDVELQSVADNCDVAGANPRSVNVVAGQTTDVSVTVDCTRTTGDIRVTTTTSGSDPDPTGYEVTVSGVGSRSIDNTDEELFEDLQPGGYTVELTGLAVNCSVSGDPVQNRTVTADDEVLVAYTIDCVPLVGDLRVNVSTTGDDLDTDYTATLLGVGAKPVSDGAPATFSDVPTGSHTVTLDDVADNCEIVGPDSKSGTVEFGTTEDVDFDVTCTGLMGDLQVTTQTTGEDPDTGYSLVIDSGSPTSIGPNTTETFQLADGNHSVELTDVAGNCTVGGNNPRTVTVPANGTEPTTFSVTCTSTTGSIEVDVSTSGVDEDSDGYTITLDGGTPRSVGINGGTTYSGLMPDDYDVGIDETTVADNCTVNEANPHTESVTAANTSNVSFTVTCEEITGSVQVNVTTGGQDPDTQYTATLSGGQGSQSVPANGSTTFTGVPVGNYTVTISGIASNCTDDDGDNQEQVTVMEDATANADFSYTCTSTTGSIDVDVSTSGLDEDPNGYTITLDGGTPRSVGINGGTTYSGLMPDDYDVGIDETTVADNCTVNEANPHTESVSAASTSNVSFTVTCEEITGSVQVNMTTTGVDQDTEYTATLSGGQGSLTVPANGTETFTGVPVGNYTVTISGIASNCTDDDGDNQEQVTVMEDATENADFSYTCTSTTGSIEVTTTTTGTNLDLDGYTVDLDGTAQMTIQANETVTFPEVTQGMHTVTLSGQEANCTITSTNPLAPTVTAGETESIGFTVECT